jgi:hypothetical protein
MFSVMEPRHDQQYVACRPGHADERHKVCREICERRCEGDNEYESVQCDDADDERETRKATHSHMLAVYVEIKRHEGRPVMSVDSVELRALYAEGCPRV